MIATVDTYITVYYGKRCADHCPGCITCTVWAIRDALAMALHDDEIER